MTSLLKGRKTQTKEKLKEENPLIGVRANLKKNGFPLQNPQKLCRVGGIFLFFESLRIFL